jgi:hypothetical protein
LSGARRLERVVVDVGIEDHAEATGEVVDQAWKLFFLPSNRERFPKNQARAPGARQARSNHL